MPLLIPYTLFATHATLTISLLLFPLHFFFFGEEPLHLLNNTLRRNIVYWTTTHFLDSERATDRDITSFLLDTFIHSVAFLSYWMPYTVTHSVADLMQTTKETRKQSIKCYPLKTNENRTALKVRKNSNRKSQEIYFASPNMYANT